jgi:hypothetical protein
MWFGTAGKDAKLAALEACRDKARPLKDELSTGTTSSA